MPRQKQDERVSQLGTIMQHHALSCKTHFGLRLVMVVSLPALLQACGGVPRNELCLSQYVPQQMTAET